MTDLTDHGIDAALAASEITEPDNGNSGAPATMANGDMHEPEDTDIDRLVDELVAFVRATSRTAMEQNA